MSPSPFQNFFRTEAATGALLVFCACVALLVANSQWSGWYDGVLASRFAFGPEGHAVSLTFREWINDGLMPVFFLLVGLEIKREVVGGELATWRKAALPVVAAVGGMFVPAVIYLGTIGGGDRGWAIPMATDIAFALGTLALVAPRAPAGLKVFLAALAIADDMGAVLVIAAFYTRDIAWTPLMAAGVLYIGLVSLNLIGSRRLMVYLIVGVGLLFFVHESGIHATIAGVLLASTIPASGGATSPLVRLENALHGFSAFVVMPLFALANAGVSLTGTTSGRVTLAVILGLAMGKPLGITAGAFAAVRLRLADLPNGVSWMSLHACAWLGGIGFTMSLFMATLAFGTGGLLDAAKVGILAGSVLSAVVGAVVLSRSLATTRRAAHSQDR